MLVDSHCHLDRLDLAPFGGEIDAVLAAARAQGVGGFLCVAIDRSNCAAVVELAERHPQVWATVGIHPNEEERGEITVEELVALAAHPRVVAIGETGLDYFRTEPGAEWQLSRFRSHIAAARATGKPLVVHSREAAADTLRLLREEGAERVGGVMHCFVDDWATAQAALDLGFYISLSGIVTFNSAAQVREVAARVPLDRLLVETDAPYLAPVPHRGKPNYPAYVRHVAERIAELRGLPFDELAAATTENFHRLFPGANRAG